MRNTQTGGGLRRIGATLTIAACLLAGPGKGQTSAPPAQAAGIGAAQTLTLEECLRTAMEGNHRRRASKFAVVMAEARHRQALAGYWPQISGKAGCIQKSCQATLDAMKAAVENRDLNTRACQNELVETEKVIRAQLVEALLTAQHYKTRYDHLALQSSMVLVVGTEVLNKLKLSQ